MRHDEFIAQVQDRARLPSPGDAERLTRAALETLGERLPEETATGLAGELPRELGEYLGRTATTSGAGQRFGVQEFVHRVADRASPLQPDATAGTQAVLGVLEEATTGALAGELRANLPPDLEQLLDAGSRDGGQDTLAAEGGSMQRGSTKHGPRHDDALAGEVEGMIRGTGPTHAQEWKDPEPPADDDPDLDERTPKTDR